MDRDNRRRRSQKRRRARIKRNGLQLNTKIIILFATIISIVLIYISINLLKSISANRNDSRDNKIQETKNENIIETSVEDSIENTNKSIQNIIDNKLMPSQVIKKNIEEFIDLNKVQKDKVNVIYASKDDVYIRDENMRIPMRNYNIYIISMILEDLKEQGKIDLNKSVDLNEFYEEKVEDKPLGLLVKEMIIKPEEEGVLALTQEVKNIVNMEWKTYANGRFSINIDDENTMHIKDISKMLQLLITKDKAGYKYKNTLSYMKDATKIRSDLNNARETEFIGIEGAVIYEYSIESGYVMKEKPYIYLIYAQYSDLSVLEEIRNIIINAN